MVLSQLGFLRGVCSSNSKQLMRGGLERGRERGPEMRGEGCYESTTRLARLERLLLSGVRISSS
jgi:hypothetical protein